MMSLFSGGRSKDGDLFSRKSQFYVEFLGWMECRGLRGHRYTDPIIRELLRRQRYTEARPKLTIEVSRKEVKITQNVPDKSRKGVKKIKFPTIPTRDITYVQQATGLADGRLDDTVACIYLGYMPRTQRYVHVHIYRFDEAKTAALFAAQMAAVVMDNADRIQKVEADLVRRGEIDDPATMPSDALRDARTVDSAVGSASSSDSNEGSPTFSSEDVEPDLQSLRDVQPFDSVAEELKFRLQISDTPLLLPPKDYDTVRRGHGNLIEANRRRCLNLNIVGENALLRDRADSRESGVDLVSPASDLGEASDKIHHGKEWPHNESMKPEVQLSSNVFLQQNTKAGSQLPQKLPKPQTMKTLPQETNMSTYAVLENAKPRSRLGNQSPEVETPIVGSVYPPRFSSGEIYLQHHKNPLTRHVSEDSSVYYYLQDHQRGPHTSRPQRVSSHEIYSSPLRISRDLHQHVSLGEEIYSGYHNQLGERLKQPGWPQNHRRSLLARTMSEDYTGLGTGLGIDRRPFSVEFHPRNGISQIDGVTRQQSPSSPPSGDNDYFSRWK